jgi:cob(I)alamin adenosyltransferase
MKIYTKTGDCGTTGLFAGPRVDKDHPRIDAYGSVDELNAVLGVVIGQLQLAVGDARWGNADPTPEELCQFLTDVQSDLFSMGAELATPDPVKHGMCLLKSQRIEALEQFIDRLDAVLPTLESFILPGGSQPAAMLHLGRTVCRRAERQVVHLSHEPGVHDCSQLVIYLNRLSDLLFVLARYVNYGLDVQESVWHAPR